MKRVLSIALVIVGLAVAVFYVALLAIADCSTACQERGERAPVFALIGAGIGLATFGLLANKLGRSRASGAGLVVLGAIVTAGNADVARQVGASGATLVALVGGVIAFGVGAMLLRPKSR